MPTAPRITDAAPGPSRRVRPVGGLVAVALGASLAGLAVYAVFVLDRTGQRLDDRLGGRIAGVAVPAGPELSVITVWSFAAALAVVVAVGAVRRRPVLGLVSAGAAGVAVMVVEVLKDHVVLRPDLGWGTYNTFPSGHTAVAVAVALAAVTVIPRRWRMAAGVVTGAYAAVVAVQVQLAGWHRPSDTAAGALVTLAVFGAAAAALASYRPVRREQGRPARIAGATAALAALVAAAGVLGVAAGRPTLGGAAIGVGSVVVVLGGWSAVLDHVELDPPRAPAHGTGPRSG